MQVRLALTRRQLGHGGGEKKSGHGRRQECISTSLSGERGEKGWVLYQQATPLEQGLGLKRSFWAMPSSFPAHFSPAAKTGEAARGKRQEKKSWSHKILLPRCWRYEIHVEYALETSEFSFGVNSHIYSAKEGDLPHEVQTVCHQRDVSLDCRIRGWEGSKKQRHREISSDKGIRSEYLHAVL